MPRRLKRPPPPLGLGTESIGRRIARFRKERGYTQVELAAKIGIPQRLVSDYETGRLHLNDEMIARFAIALEVSADNILGLSGNGQKQIKPSLKIIRRVNRIESLPSSKQRALLQIIDGFLDGAESNNNKRHH